MAPIDDYIRKNLDHFNDEEPLQGHFGRFEKRLDHSFYQRTDKKGLWFLTKIAATVLFAMIISHFAFYQSGYYKRNLDRILFSNNYPELREAEKYYTSQLDSYYSKIKELRFNNDKTQKKQILDELSDLDRQVQSMKHDLIQNPDDERVMHAIINCYQVRLELMDMIISRTQESNNTIL